MIPRRWFLTKEALYPFTSGATGQTGTCNKSRLAGTAPEDKVQLVGTGFRHLRQWSATALKEVRGAASPAGSHISGRMLLPWQVCVLDPHLPSLRILQAVKVAPTIVGIYVPDDSLFDLYSGGLWSASSCPLPPGPPNPAKATVNHALLVVGWNSLAKPPYW